MLTIGTLVLGVNDVARATDFWHAALGYVPREPGDDRWVTLVPASGPGARRVDWDLYPEDPDFLVLEDPDGNRFCVIDKGTG